MPNPDHGTLVLDIKPSQKAKMPWHQKIITEKLDAVIEGKIKRIMFLVPPRHGKTELVSRSIPKIFLKVYPDKKCLLVTYHHEIAHRLGEDVSRNFGDRFRSVGVGAPLPAIGFDLILIDDPTRNYREVNDEIIQDNLWRWYKRLLLTLKHNSATVLIMNRWGENDFAGKLLKEEPDQWEVLSFPAICHKENCNDFDHRNVGEALWPEKHSTKQMLKAKSLDRKYFEAVYQQRPIS